MPATPLRKPLRAVLVGAGTMGRHHASAIARAGGALVAVVDPDVERARELARDGIALGALAELAGPVDVVHICAPLGEHAGLAEQALALGAHLVVEKPLTPDAPTTAALLAAAEEKGLLLVPVHQFLFQPGVQRLLAARQQFDPLVRCVFEAATAGAERGGVDPDELVADILPHPLALFSRFAPGALGELEWLTLRPGPGELRALAHSGGTTFEIVVSTRARPTHATLDLVGTSATAHADLFHGFAAVERGAATRTRKVTRPFTVAGSTLVRASGNLARRAATRELAYPGLRELVRRTYDAIANRAPAPIEGRETLAVAVARDAILTAAGAPAPARTPL